jgi:hypothetical protein
MCAILVIAWHTWRCSTGIHANQNVRNRAGACRQRDRGGYQLSGDRSSQSSGVVLRVLLRAIVVVAATPIGFVAAAYIATATVIRADAGLAGGAEVLFYGVIGALIASVVAGILVYRLRLPVLIRSSLVAALLLGLLAAWVLWSWPASQAPSTSSGAQPRATTGASDP